MTVEKVTTSLFREGLRPNCPSFSCEKDVAVVAISVISAAHVTGNDIILLFSGICGCLNSGEAIII